MPLSLSLKQLRAIWEISEQAIRKTYIAKLSATALRGGPSPKPILVDVGELLKLLRRMATEQAAMTAVRLTNAKLTTQERRVDIARRELELMLRRNRLLERSEVEQVDQVFAEALRAAARRMAGRETLTGPEAAQEIADALESVARRYPAVIEPEPEPEPGDE